MFNSKIIQRLEFELSNVKNNYAYLEQKHECLEKYTKEMACQLSELKHELMLMREKVKNIDKNVILESEPIKKVLTKKTKKEDINGNE